ncbi:MAG: hypothetical protein JKY67_05805 [Pseudomonadales bacterium]|nr:hypothetical protein [Pseudomonadales bacterium]
MERLRKQRNHCKALVVLILLSLVLQVQPVFACQMNSNSGLMKHCCCDKMKSHEDSGDKQAGISPCCDFSAEVQLKSSSDLAEEAITVQSQSSPKLSPMTFVVVSLTLWPDLVDQPTHRFFRYWDVDPGHPGTHTYLSTLRLRI